VPDLLTPWTKEAMRDTGREGSREVTIPSDPAVARELQDEIERALQAHHFEERDIFSIRLALEEALVNAIKHGNQADRSKHVHVAYRVNGERFDVRIRDEGPGFDPEDIPDPLADENLERPCGRGLFLMRHYMTEVTYHHPGNLVTMTKLRGAPQKNGCA
jgi:serine/threonine-protein kinase RsbW